MEPQTNDTLTQTPPVTQPIPPKKNFSLIIIFSTILLGLLGGVIYLAYQNNLLRQQLSSPVILPRPYPLETPPLTPTPSPTPNLIKTNYQEEILSSYCSKTNVAVRLCKDGTIKISSFLPGGGTSYINNDSQINCPVVSPELITQECKELRNLQCLETPCTTN